MMDSSDPPPLSYTREEVDQANEDWGASCGPVSLAAALGAPLALIRAVVVPLGFGGWMNPTMMGTALEELEVRFELVRSNGPALRPNARMRIIRIQWEGPWMERSVKEQYRHTHWIAWCRPTPTAESLVLCTATCPSEWQRETEWRARLKSRNTPWHPTHHYCLSPASESPCHPVTLSPTHEH